MGSCLEFQAILIIDGGGYDEDSYLRLRTMCNLLKTSTARFANPVLLEANDVEELG